MRMSDVLVVLITAPIDEAARLSDALVAEGLAACVNVVPAIDSVYRWEGNVARDREALLLVKTNRARYQDLERRVKELHSYSTPEIIGIEVTRGSPEYLRWVDESTARIEDIDDKAGG